MSHDSPPSNPNGPTGPIDTAAAAPLPNMGTATQRPARPYDFAAAMQSRHEEWAKQRPDRSAKNKKIAGNCNPLQLVCDNADLPRVFVPAHLVRLSPHPTAALLLAQVATYWFSLAKKTPSEKRALPRARIRDLHKRRWLAHTYRHLSNETGLTVTQVRWAIESLQRRPGRKVKNRRRDKKQSVKDLQRAGWLQTGRHRGVLCLRPTDACVARLNAGISRRGVTVPAIVVRITDGNVARAMVLSQLCYWFSDNEKGECRASIVRDGRLLVAKSIDELAEETGLQPGETRRAVEWLRRRGLITTSVHWFAGRRQLHFAVEHEATWLAFERADDQAYAARELEWAHRA